MRTATASATVPLEVSPWQRLLGVYVRWSSRNPWLASVLPFVPVVVAWAAIAKSGLFPPVFLPGPVEVIQKFGTLMPTSFAASSTFVPLGAATLLPSIVRLTTGVSLNGRALRR